MKIPYSLEHKEAQRTGYYARALKRIVKRRRALAQGSPYGAGIIGVADSFAFFSGQLLYIVEDRPMRRLRILDLQGATNEELEVNIPALVTLAVPASEGCKKYTFRVLHHAAGITSCLYAFARPSTQNWLVVFNAREHTLIRQIPLESAICLFVRNNADHLVFGTHSEYDANGIRKWVMWHYNIRTDHLSDKLYLTNLVGYDLGSTVCFEFFGNHFYGCSNQTAFELEEIDWTSHFYCFRLPLDDFRRASMQVMTKRDAFRRQHAEGPIDDRWGFLSLEQDEETGRIRIVECRKEWLAGRSGNMRTYYTKDVKFNDGVDEDSDGDENDPLPPVQVASLLRSMDRPSYIATTRPPHEFHHGDDGSVLFSKSKTYLSCYHHACGTFIDLVDDPLLDDDACTQRLRIRAGAWDFDKSTKASATQSSPREPQLGESSAVGVVTQHNTITFWPPGPQLGRANSYCDQLNQSMNPSGLTGKVTAVSDGRSIIYATSSGKTGDLSILFLITFDPGIRLAGMTRAGRLDGERVEMRQVGRQESGTSYSQYIGSQVPSVLSPMQQDPAVTSVSRSQNLPFRTLPPPAEGKPWACIQKAMHLSFPGQKFTFAQSKYGTMAGSEQLK
jgi:hypothetical protein